MAAAPGVQHAADDDRARAEPVGRQAGQRRARNPCTIAETDIAPAVSPRDQRNSAISGTKNTEKEKNKP